MFTSREPSPSAFNERSCESFSLQEEKAEAEEAPARRPDKAQRTLRVVFFLRSPPSTRLRQIHTESSKRERESGGKSGEARTRENSRPHAVHNYLFRRWKKKQQKKKEKKERKLRILQPTPVSVGRPEENTQATGKC